MRQLASRAVRFLGMLAILLVCQFAHVVASLWALVAICTGSDRAWRIFKGYDRVGNAATGGLDTETVSSRANRARAENRRWGCVLCRVLDWIEKDHCSKSAGV
jgi:hypothetical protein